MKAFAIPNQFVVEAIALKRSVMEPNGINLRLLSSAFWRSLNPFTVCALALISGRYGIPTIETVAWLKEQIAGRSAIEIGAGYGDFAYHLGIPATDSHAQSDADVLLCYAAMGQPTIDYPDAIERLTAAEAIAKYRPQVVIASWVTQLFDERWDKEGEAQAFIRGVDELALLNEPCIETYIVLGNMNSHGRKRARRKKHSVLKGDAIGLVSRAVEAGKNCAFLWHTNS